MNTSIPACPVCGTWTCSQCGWKRSRASLSWVHSCHRCGGTRGLLVPSRHRDEVTRAEHAADALEANPMTNRPVCPDGGTCHHECTDGSLRNCFRVSSCAPLSGVYVNDRWPEFEPGTPAPKHKES